LEKKKANVGGSQKNLRKQSKTAVITFFTVNKLHTHTLEGDTNVCEERRRVHSPIISEGR